MLYEKILLMSVWQLRQKKINVSSCVIVIIHGNNMIFYDKSFENLSNINYFGKLLTT
jgi:hypothetical protein